MKKFVLALAFIALVFPGPANVAAQDYPVCDLTTSRPTGAVAELTGTPHLWIQDADGRLHWAGDTRALAGQTVRWESRCTGGVDFFQRAQVGDPYLSAGLG